MKKISVSKILISVFILTSFISCGKKVEETTPIRRDVTETVFASGVIVAEGMYKLTAQTSGYISQLNFEEGSNVLEGNVLAVIENNENVINTQGAAELLSIAKSNSSKDAPQLLQAEYNIKISQQRMEHDEKIKDRYERLWKSNSIAKIDYENALLTYQTSQNNYQSAIENYKKLQRDAEQQLVNNQTSTNVFSTVSGKNQIKAVVKGKVYSKLKELGDYVRQGDVIAEIGSDELLYAQVSIDESNISRIKIGQEAIIQLNVNAEKNYKGRVHEILPSFDEATQSFICKINFTDSLDFRIVNTQLQTNIIVGEQKDALLIPRNYLDFGSHVQIKGQEGKTKVETKFVSNEWVQVSSGLDENSVLVTDNIIADK